MKPAGVVPSPDEVADMQARVDRLITTAQAALDAEGLAGEATIQGSLAKGTWLAGSADADVFLLMPPETPQEGLVDAVERVGARILEAPRKKYAQHPYLIGRAEGLDVDLVPAYRVTDPEQKMSAVDRTPFHTAWVLDHIGQLADDVRLAKRWCKGVGIYGADTLTGGFSGYLVEVLTIHAGGFEPLLRSFAAGDWPRTALGADAVVDDVSPWVVVDPVDASRNCAAAVTPSILARAQEGAQAFLSQPDERFFFPATATAAPLETLQQSMTAQGVVWLGLRMDSDAERMDIVGPQFQRAARVLSESMERAGFPVRRSQVDFLEQVCLQWIVDDVCLPPTKRHRGPRADQHPNAERFRSKWQSQGLEVIEGDVLEVDVPVAARTPAEAMDALLPNLQSGKHVRAAKKGPVETQPPTRGSWAPLVTDFVLNRRPWQP